MTRLLAVFRHLQPGRLEGEVPGQLMSSNAVVELADRYLAEQAVNQVAARPAVDIGFGGADDW